MYKNISFILLLIMSSFVSCSSNSKTNIKVSTAESIENITPKKEKATVQKTNIEKLPLELLNKTFTTCNAIDATFYEGNKSINLWDKNVGYILSMFKNEAPTVLSDKIVGHIMLLKDGNQLAFVEISMNENNNYFIFNIDDKKYYNTITDKGIEFFKKMNTKTVSE